MLGPTFEDQEAWLQKTTRDLDYPQTPDIAGAVMQRIETGATTRRPTPRKALVRFTWAIAVMAAILVGLLAVPSVRAGFSEFIQIGIVRIFLGEPAPTVPAAVSTVPGSTPINEVTSTLTPGPTPTLLPRLLDLDGKTTLPDAQQSFDFPILLPTHPANLGEPDHVFLQDMDGPVVILIWMDLEKPDQIRLSLHMYGPGTFAEKMQPRTVQVTEVNGQHAVWTAGLYTLRLRNGDIDIRRLIDGHVLIWEQSSITYRLETDLEMEEAVIIAESLR